MRVVFSDVLCTYALAETAQMLVADERDVRRPAHTVVQLLMAGGILGAGAAVPFKHIAETMKMWIMVVAGTLDLSSRYSGSTITSC